MSFHWPQLLWLLALPAILLFVEIVRRVGGAIAAHPKILRARAGRRSLRLEPVARQSKIQTPKSKIRPLLHLGLALTIAACARPQWGRIEEPVFDQSREILIALDLSRSMDATDVKPTRLDRARLLVNGLLSGLKGERVGLVVFAGTAFLQSPLSSDYEILRDFLPLLNTKYLPQGGTDYTALLNTALSSFGQSDSADRFLIILSDGEANDETWRPLAEKLKERNIRVIALGVGTEAGSIMPDGAGGLIKDERGAVVLSKLEPKTLQELATVTNGVYTDASSWIALADLIDETVATGRKGVFREENRVRLAERFQWPLAAALLFLALGYWFEFPVRPKNRAIRLAATVAQAAKPAPQQPRQHA
ncbi:MAG: VWA domain-containing protein [Opitutaceae bacterium]|jgi:Ca-activated chloride channel family protein|nr:VWA domain-containing protein [Opitutaceae bacterium]